MKNILSYILSVGFYLCFGLALVIFHPIQWISFNLFGYKAHKKSVDVLQLFLLRSLNVLGSKISFENTFEIPDNNPVIVIANHQSMYDIPPIIWFLRKHHPKFISKIELGRGIPSVSFNLRHGGSVLIDRKNPRQSLPAIMKFADYIRENNRAAVIFPEGTRSKTGVPKKFQHKGLEILFKKIPNATIVPLSINNSWKIQNKGNFPLGIGAHIKFKVHHPLKLSDFETSKEAINHIESVINKNIIRLPH